MTCHQSLAMTAIKCRHEGDVAYSVHSRAKLFHELWAEFTESAGNSFAAVAAPNSLLVSGHELR